MPSLGQELAVLYSLGTVINNLSNAAPATATSIGVVGSIAYDAGFIYICVAANTWKRVAIAAW